MKTPTLGRVPNGQIPGTVLKRRRTGGKDVRKENEKKVGRKISPHTYTSVHTRTSLIFNHYTLVHILVYNFYVFLFFTYFLSFLHLQQSSKLVTDPH